MFFITFIFQNLIFYTGANPESCLLRCKDDYMNQMQNLLSDSTSEWSVNLVTPLQNLFHHASKHSIRPRVESACRSHDTFLNCLQNCEETAARQAIMNGQESWITICHSFRTDDEFTNFVLPCWAQHGDEITKKCHIHALMVQNSAQDLLRNGLVDVENSLADLCRTITIYDKCYIWQTDQYCGERGWRFLLNLNQRASMALIKMLSESQLIDTLPPSCQLWTSPSKYAEWHAERIEAARSGAASYFKAINFLCDLFYFAGIFITYLI